MQDTHELLGCIIGALTPIFPIDEDIQVRERDADFFILHHQVYTSDTASNLRDSFEKRGFVLKVLAVDKEPTSLRLIMLMASIKRDNELIAALNLTLLEKRKYRGTAEILIVNSQEALLHKTA